MALAALGFTLIYNASNVINFAQGEFVMLPAFLMLGFAAAGLPMPLAFVFTCVVAVGVLGWAFKRGIVGYNAEMISALADAAVLRSGLNRCLRCRARPDAVFCPSLRSRFQGTTEDDGLPGRRRNGYGCS